ncbi:MAG: YndJ family transporter [Deltaproteobacteria bacterium]|nr:YndJ family transporter [Deltaproteobacteria bacterium]
MRRGALAAALGALVWGALSAVGVGELAAWPRALVAFAALVIVPLGLALVYVWGPRVEIVAVAAALLGLSTRLDAGSGAGILATPWLAVTLSVALGAVREAWRRRPLGSAWPERAALAARLFVPIGAAWMFADRLGATPFGFDTTTVILTAAHFHYAGFALPIIASLAARARPSRLADAACAGVIAGVPAVAIGISATHAGLTPWLETGAVVAFGGAVLAVGAIHLTLARDGRQQRLSRVLFGVAAAALALGTSLALVYGLRTVAPGFAFDLDFMWTVHGSLQALGFTLPALVGWWVALLPRRVRS